METLILNNGSKKDLDLLLEIAQKLGLNLTVSNEAERYNKLRRLAKKLDDSVCPNEISMEEIVEEVRSVRREKSSHGEEDHS
ncbi:hypothetical protein [Kaistella palustris]|uniref:hypothetical protein n=1 Tax=Kaistella palustris TaxID=493376 RepID=UPI0004214F6D|nr:hypothetical protein [Kaistella palustris]